MTDLLSVLSSWLVLLMLAVLAVAVWSLVSVIRSQADKWAIAVEVLRVMVVLIFIVWAVRSDLKTQQLDNQFEPLIERDYAGWAYESFAN